MATQVPELLVPTAYLSNTAADIHKPASGHKSIIRTMIIQTTSSSKTVTLDINTSTADGGATRFLDAYPLTPNFPLFLNGWYVLTNSTWLVGLTTTASTATFTAFGYDYTI